MKTTTNDNLLKAHEHSSFHRHAVLASDLCGCFYCLEIYSPSEKVNWLDKMEGVGQTAFCPNCGCDSVIGSESGYPITLEFLQEMHDQWF